MQAPISYLFVPGNRPERFDKAVAAGPDAVILDLEDSVHPGGKAEARSAVRSWHERTPASGCRRYIRLNGNSLAVLREDLDWLVNLARPQHCAGILLPKAEDGDVVAAVALRLRQWSAGADLVAIIETAKGLHHVDGIASANGLSRLAFGSLDFSLDMQCQHTNDAFLLARSKIVLASRIAGLPPPIDGVTPALNDPEGLATDVAHARSLGFAAKFCIHPSQVDVVNAGFRPSREKLAWARRVVEATASGSHAVQVDGEMVDLPLIEAARKVLQHNLQHAGH